MKQKTVWLLCAVLWTAATIFRLFTVQNALVIGYHVITAFVFWGMFLAQGYCDKRGEQGQKLIKRIDIIALVIVVALTLVVLLH